MWKSPGITVDVALDNEETGATMLLQTLSDDDVNPTDGKYDVMIPMSSDEKMKKFQKNGVECLPFRVSF